MNRKLLKTAAKSAGCIPVQPDNYALMFSRKNVTC